MNYFKYKITYNDGGVGYMSLRIPVGYSGDPMVLAVSRHLHTGHGIAEIIYISTTNNEEQRPPIVP